MSKKLSLVNLSLCLLPGSSSPSTLTGKVNQLEVILRQLQYDLRKVRLHTLHSALHKPVFRVGLCYLKMLSLNYTLVFLRALLFIF